jgi:hypothetical protein
MSRNGIFQTLNEAYAAAPGAMYALVCNRVPCNTALAEHPSIQVNTIVTQPETFSVGMMGIINGILERTTGRRVAAKFSDDKQPVQLGFVPAVVSGVGALGGGIEQSSVTPAKHHDPRLAQATVCLETWGLRRCAYIVADPFYLTKLGTWTFGVQAENNWRPDLDSAKAFLLRLRELNDKQSAVTVS